MLHTRRFRNAPVQKRAGSETAVAQGVKRGVGCIVHSVKRGNQNKRSRCNGVFRSTVWKAAEGLRR
eukprot:715790-Rhodomonas_salina.2